HGHAQYADRPQGAAEVDDLLERLRIAGAFEDDARTVWVDGSQERQGILAGRVERRLTSQFDAETTPIFPRLGADDTAPRRREGRHREKPDGPEAAHVRELPALRPGRLDRTECHAQGFAEG